jgi:hypothetical protein
VKLHTYSLRYDFGYDDEDHAGRYIAERDKLATGCPNTTQIAHRALWLSRAG